MAAILFGSISTVADTSELQREAFNAAFEQHGLGWHWDQAEYRSLLTKNGGAGRIADYASERGETVDATAVHDTKSKLFQQRLAAGSLTSRPGVVDSIRAAKSQGLKVGLVTTTSPANVAALFQGLSAEITANDFDVIVDATSVKTPKPDGAAYAFAVTSLGEDTASCVAIEDNLGGVQAAEAAHVRAVAFPNENTAGHDFGTTRRVDHIALMELRPDATGA